MASAPQSAEATTESPPASSRAVFSWCLYDWANSAFPTVIGTFIFSTYFTQAIAVTPETGTAQWGRALGTAGILVALAAPVFGAIADRGGRRKPWLDRKSTRLNSSH